MAELTEALRKLQKDGPHTAPTIMDKVLISQAGFSTMHKVVTVDMEKDILAANRKLADQNRALLDEHGIRAFDFLGAIGSGKTLIIERLIEKLMRDGKRCAAIAGDVAGDDDYRRFSTHGVAADNISTGKECHLDAHMVDRALERLPLADLDYVFVENVGNLVCPVDFPLGSHLRVVVISVTEGGDMVRKHPAIFAFSDVVVINKVDLADAMEVDPDSLATDARKTNPKARIVIMNARQGKGIDDLAEALGL